MAENQNNLYQSKPAIANKFLNPNGGTSTLDEIITQVVPGTTSAETTSTPTKEYQSKPAVANKFLNTDGTYSTLDEILARTIGGITQFDVEVVEELPEVGEKGVLYLVPNEGSGGNIYDEYVWIPSTESFEKIGTTEIDLSGYEQLINKVTAIDGQSTDTQYPSAKLLYDQLGLKLNGKNLFKTSYKYICNKSTDNNYLYSASMSTFGEKLEDGIYEVAGLEYTSSGSDSIQSPSIDYGQSILYYVSQQRKAAIPIHLEDQGTGYFPATLVNGVLWQSYIQSTYDKVTSISSSSTDTQYPSAKAVFDSLPAEITLTGDYTWLTPGEYTISTAAEVEKLEELEAKIRAGNIPNFGFELSNANAKIQITHFEYDTTFFWLNGLWYTDYNSIGVIGVRILRNSFDGPDVWTIQTEECSYIPDFVGTNGGGAGVRGLVPAPLVSDVGKYLKADGTWASVPNPSNITQQEIISLFS